MSKWQVVKCPACNGTGVKEVIDQYTKGGPNSLPGCIMRWEKCSYCSGKSFVKVNVDELNEIGGTR